LLWEKRKNNIRGFILEKINENQSISGQVDDSLSKIIPEISGITNSALIISESLAEQKESTSMINSATWN